MTGRRLALAALVGAVAALLAWTVDWDAVARAWSALAARPGPLAAALAAYTLAFVLRAAAWGPLLPAPVPLGARVQAILGMLAVNHALPGPVGEVARARLVADGASVTFRAALLSVAAARVVDVAALAVLATAAAALAGEAPGWLRLAAPAAAALPFVAWALARRRGATLTSAEAVRVAAWAVPSWALETGIVLVVARAAGAELSWAGAVLATCAGVLAQVARVLPGGVGTYEAGVASVLVPLGVPLGEALGVAATTHAVKFAYAFLAGGAALAWRRRSPAASTAGPTAAAPAGVVADARP